MTKKYNSKVMKKFVEKASSDTYFIGNILSKYKDSHKLDDNELSRYLNCKSTDIKRLALCRVPDDSKDSFQRDIQHIADFVSCNADNLIKLIREINIVEALLQASKKDFKDNMLMAARDDQTENNKKDR
jgi:hypothetical protein